MIHVIQERECISMSRLLVLWGLPVGLYESSVPLSDASVHWLLGFGYRLRWLLGIWVMPVSGQQWV